MKTVRNFSPFLNEIIGFALLLCLWSAAAIFYPGYVIPSPVAVFKAIPVLATSQTWHALGLTVLRTAAGFAMALFLGSSLAYLSRGSQLARLLTALQQAIQVLPAIILGVIFVILFGIGHGTPIMLTFLMSIPFVFINTLSLVESPDPALSEYLISINADRKTWWQGLLKPQLIKASYINLSTGLSFALKVAIMGEFIGSQNGIGYLLNRARIVFEMKEVFFYLLLLVAITLILEGVILYIFHYPLKKYFYA